MDDEVYCCIGCILAIFLIFAGISIFDAYLDWDYHNSNTVYLKRAETSITNYSYESENGNVYNDYSYSVQVTINNASSRLEGSQLVISLYDKDKLISFDNPKQNNITLIIGDEETSLDGSHLYGAAFFHLENYTNVTHCRIQIIYEDDVILDAYHSFNMKNYENYEPTYFNEDLDEEDTSSSDDLTSSDFDRIYVASVNSNKFHDPSCSQAKRIKESNKITFSSREEAINSGYTPCGICYP